MLRIVFACLILTVITNATPLDDYVNTPDPNYKYELIKTYNQEGFKMYVLNMTSQKWQNESVVSNPIWWHYLCVTIPDQVTIKDAGVIWIDGGKNSDGLDETCIKCIFLT